MHTPVIFCLFDSNSGLPSAKLGCCDMLFDVMQIPTERRTGKISIEKLLGELASTRTS